MRGHQGRLQKEENETREEATDAGTLEDRVGHWSCDACGISFGTSGESQIGKLSQKISTRT